MGYKTATFGERIIADGIRVSNNNRLTGLNGHDLIIGGSSSGKTTGYICSNLNNPHGSFVVQDTKGQLLNQFSASLKRKGYKTIIFDFVNPEKSCPYNPLSYIRRRKDGSPVERDIKKLAVQLTPTLDRDEPFWEKACARFISMLIAYVLEALPNDEHHMGSVVAVHRLLQEPLGKALLNEWAQESPESYSARKYKMLVGSMVADRMWGSIIEFVNEVLDPFDVSEYGKMFLNPNSWDIREAGRRPCAVFINTSDHDPSYGILTSTLYSQILQVLLDEADAQTECCLKVPVRLILDDFASAASIKDFDKTISIIRSRNISVSILLQSLSQLESMYSQSEAYTIINNCDHILYLGGGHDLRTAEFIANHINKTPHSVLTLPRDKAILITSGEEPQIVNKIKPNNPITGLHFDAFEEYEYATPMEKPNSKEANCA